MKKREKLSQMTPAELIELVLKLLEKIDHLEHELAVAKKSRLSRR